MKDKPKIKILIGINDFLVGGAQKLIIDVVTYSDRDIFEYHLVTLMHFDDRADFYDELPSHIIVHRLNFKSFFDFTQIKKLIAIIRSIQPDIVWSHLFFSNTIFRVLRVSSRYICIATEHNTYSWKKFHHKVIDFLLSFVTYKIVAVSKSVAEYTSAQEKISLDRFCIIHNGIDVAHFTNTQRTVSDDEIRDELSLATNEKLIINVGRLLKQKNHTPLIKTFNMFRSQYPEYHLVLLGDGPLKEKLQRYVETLGLSGYVHILGTRKNVADYYKTSEFFVLSSEIEGFAIVGIEAMACGLPVVSTRVAGPDEYVIDGENGVLVDHTPEALLLGMKQMASLSHEQRLEYAKNSIDTAKKFNITESARKYEELFREAVH